jgi:zinc transporter 2
VGEVVGGIYAHSLAILTDAAHLLSDLAGFLISIFAIWLSTKSPTSRLSFGFHRAEILGALTSVLIIWLVTGVLVYEAINRMLTPENVDGRLMFILAASGLGVNVLMGVVLYKSGHGHSHGAPSQGK